MIPLPPALLRERVTGTGDSQWFLESGARTLKEWDHALLSSGVNFREVGSILDFGCGCGRVLRHITECVAPSQKVLGADVDEEAVEWVRENISRIEAVQLNIAPSPLADNSLDLIVSQSVFTHLPEDVALSWIADLHRALKPGGVFLTSVHGEKVVREHF